MTLLLIFGGASADDGPTYVVSSGEWRLDPVISSGDWRLDDYISSGDMRVGSE